MLTTALFNESLNQMPYIASACVELERSKRHTYKHDSAGRRAGVWEDVCDKQARRGWLTHMILKRRGLLGGGGGLRRRI